MWNNVRNCSSKIDVVGSFRHLFASKWWDLVFLTFFIIYLTVKSFLTDFEWVTVSLKTPTTQASVWNKLPLPGVKQFVVCEMVFLFLDRQDPAKATLEITVWPVISIFSLKWLSKWDSGLSLFGRLISHVRPENHCSHWGCSILVQGNVFQCLHYLPVLTTALMSISI